MAWLEQGQVYEVRIDLDSTSNYFGRGHRIRLEVSSSNFPRFDRNLNTGSSAAYESRYVSARNTVHHGPSRPSRLVLPVLEE
jgi:putative CocE/NonD family hydrolase